MFKTSSSLTMEKLKMMKSRSISASFCNLTSSVVFPHPLCPAKRIFMLPPGLFCKKLRVYNNLGMHPV